MSDNKTIHLTNLAEAAPAAKTFSLAGGRSDSIGQKLKKMLTVPRQLPAAAAFDDEPATGILAVFRFVDAEELKRDFALDFGSGARDEAERNAVVVQRNFVAGHALPFSEGIGLNERRVAFQPGKIRGAHQDPAKFGLFANEIQQAEVGSLLVFVEQDEAGVQSQQVLSIPFAVIVALARKCFPVPHRKAIVDEEVQFEVNVRAVFGDAFARVGGTAHGGDGLASFDILADFQVLSDPFQVRVERINFQSADVVTQDDVVSVVRERRFGAEVNDGAVRGGHDAVGRFAARVALKAFDVETFVHSPSVRAHATEPAGGPGFADGADKELFFAAGFKQGVIGSREAERLLGRGF